MSELKKKIDLAPVVLFVYRRPRHTREALNALAKCDLAKESHLFIFSDGARENETPENIANISEVRSLIREQQWCGKVTIIERPSNFGLAHNIISGVTEIVNRFGKIIVLEADLIVSKGFLHYMNASLSIYAQVPKVMHISGFSVPIRQKGTFTYFYNPPTCWGWATWADRWTVFEKDPVNQALMISMKEAWNDFTIGGAVRGFRDDFMDNINGRINTWNVFWYASIYLHGGTSLHPYPSLVQNIGYDGSGENCKIQNGDKSPFEWDQLAEYVPVTLQKVRQDKLIISRIAKFYRTQVYGRTPHWTRSVSRRVVDRLRIMLFS